MGLIQKSESEMDRQIRYFLEEKLEGILEEAQKLKKRRQEVLHGNSWEERKRARTRERTKNNENQPTLWGNETVQ
uniref:Uncharacterized protein n=1 Tax=Leptospira ellisii TaxID=2023197 RepID=A0A2N0B693_9LEPT|nr:hypothetical protein CH379_15185 [Leptospira ellisii]